MKIAPNALDLIGQRFGRLTVITKLPHKIYNGCVGWECRCDCGKEIVSITGNLRSGNTTSCGCASVDYGKEFGAANATKHGNSKHPLYQIWVDMLRRCGDPTRWAFTHYGGRGIRVCDRWVADFHAFVADMGPKPTPTHSLERNDNDGPYDPSNCRWATKSEQALNTRRTHWIEAFGERKPLVKWANECGVTSALLHQRIYRDGLTPEQAIAKSRGGRHKT